MQHLGLFPRYVSDQKENENAVELLDEPSGPAVCNNVNPFFDYVTREIRLEYESFIKDRDVNLSKLDNNNWLNEDVIDLYFRLYLQPIANKRKNYTIFIGNYFTVNISNKSIPKATLLSLVRENIDIINAILSKYKMEEVQRIVTWVNVSNIHWVLMVIDFHWKKIHYLDPFGSYSRYGNIDARVRTTTTRMLKVLFVLGYIKVEPGCLKTYDFNYIDPSWKDIQALNKAYQLNNYDCGVFLLTFAEMFANNFAQLNYEYDWVEKVNMSQKRKEIKKTLYAFSDWRKYLNTYATSNQALVKKNLYAEICEIDVNALKEDSKPSFFESMYDPRPIEVY